MAQWDDRRYNEPMARSHEDTHYPAADDEAPPGSLVLRNFVTRVNQLCEILGQQPVLTPEIKERLGHDACFWASRGVDLSNPTGVSEEIIHSLDSPSYKVIDDTEFRNMTLRNLGVLYQDYTKGTEEEAPEIPQEIRESLGQLAIYLAGQGVDLSRSPEISEDDMIDQN